MKINVTVKIQSKHEVVEQIDSHTLVVKVNVPPIDGKANKRIIELLAKHFKTAKSRIHLAKGAKSKNKTFIVDEDI